MHNLTNKLIAVRTFLLRHHFWHDTLLENSSIMPHMVPSSSLASHSRCFIIRSHIISTSQQELAYSRKQPSFHCLLPAAAHSSIYSLHIDYHVPGTILPLYLHRERGNDEYNRYGPCLCWTISTLRLIHDTWALPNFQDLTFNILQESFPGHFTLSCSPFLN